RRIGEGRISRMTFLWTHGGVLTFTSVLENTTRPPTTSCRWVPMDGLGATMTFRIGSKRNDTLEARRCRAFTLIELILVMAMLLIVLSVAFPSLKGFFRGRNLDSEARRFLALTQYGQSRAVSEGIPMVLWIDARRGAYGLQVQPGYVDSDNKAVQFALGDALQLEVQSALKAQSSQLNG